MTESASKAHRLLAPRIAYLIGTRDRDGTPNVVPVSNVTSASIHPQHLLLAVYKQWRTYETLLNTDGFTLSIPLISHLQGVWKLGARYSYYPAKNPQEKLAASGLSFDYDISSYGPILTDGARWITCQTIQLADFCGDQGIVVGQAQRAWYNPGFLDLEGVPHTQANPLMQITGNRFTTTAQLHQVPYY